MKVQDLDGSVYEWRFPAKVTPRKSSQLHQRAREILKSVFPMVQLLEEVPVTVDGKKHFLDFFMPPLCIAVEVHGEQHYKYVPHFHGTARGFFRHKRRDRLKAEWCELNDITLIVLPYNEEDRWEEIING
jgi:hypothetical protein